LKKVENPSTAFKKGVSVVICAHNELENLQKFLPLFQKQKYLSFEIILVNDRSTDGTREYLLTLTHHNLEVINIIETPDGWNPKKWALSNGAKSAKNNYLLFTDADCFPNSTNWIQTMANGFNISEAVLGYSGYEYDTSFLNAFIQYETYFTAATYLGFANKGINYMAVGRNFGIEKYIYTAYDFGNYKHLNGGDDDLIINHLKPKTTSVYLEHAHTISVPKKTWVEYFTQKRRHLNIGNHYTRINKLLIGLFNVSSLLFYLSICTLTYYKIDLELTIAFFLLRTSVLFYSFTLSSKCLNIKLTKMKVIWLDFFYTLFIWTWGPIALIAKKVKWK